MKAAVVIMSAQLHVKPGHVIFFGENHIPNVKLDNFFEGDIARINSHCIQNLKEMGQRPTMYIKKSPTLHINGLFKLSGFWKTRKRNRFDIQNGG